MKKKRQPGQKVLFCPGCQTRDKNAPLFLFFLSRTGVPSWETGTTGVSQPGQINIFVVVTLLENKAWIHPCARDATLKIMLLSGYKLRKTDIIWLECFFFHYYKNIDLSRLGNPCCPGFPTGNASPGQKGVPFYPGSGNQDKR